MLLCYWIPLELGWMVAGYRFLLEHSYEEFTDQKPDTVIAETNDHHLGPIGRLVVGPHNVGYHICHHLHPSEGGAEKDDTEQRKSGNARLVHNANGNDPGPGFKHWDDS